MNTSQSKKTNLQQTLYQLEQENSDLRQELIQAQTIIEALKKENQALTKRLNSYIQKPDKAEKPDKPENDLKPSTKSCELCFQEIPSSNFDLHQVQCMRRHARCEFCNQIIPANSKDQHIIEKRGTFEDLLNDIEEGDIARLSDRETHGCKFDEKEASELGNSLLHFAVKSGKREIVQFLLNKGLSINVVNSFNESVLHVACGKSKDFAMVQFLVNQGADLRILNTMGDSAADVAKRNGFHDAVLYFQQRGMVRSRPMSARMMPRPGSGIKKNV